MYRTVFARTAALGVAAVSMQLASPANATTIYTIDDFATAVSTLTLTGNVVTAATSPQHDPFSATLDGVGAKITATTANPYTIGGYDFKRDLSFWVTQDPSGLASQKASITMTPAAGVNPAKLATATGSMVATALTLSYDISSLASLMQTIGAGDATFTVLYSDGVGTPTGLNPQAPTTITAKLDGAAAGAPIALSSAWGGSSGNGYKALYFTLPMAMVNGNDRLVFDFVGPTGYDLSISSIGVSIPEPGMLGLFGAGILGLGLARRRKR